MLGKPQCISQHAGPWHGCNPGRNANDTAPAASAPALNACWTSSFCYEALWQHSNMRGHLGCTDLERAGLQASLEASKHANP